MSEDFEMVSSPIRRRAPQEEGTRVGPAKGFVQFRLPDGDGFELPLVRCSAPETTRMAIQAELGHGEFNFFLDDGNMITTAKWFEKVTAGSLVRLKPRTQVSPPPPPPPRGLNDLRARVGCVGTLPLMLFARGPHTLRFAACSRTFRIHGAATDTELLKPYLQLRSGDPQDHRWRFLDGEIATCGEVEPPTVPHVFYDLLLAGVARDLPAGKFVLVEERRFVPTKQDHHRLTNETVVRFHYASSQVNDILLQILDRASSVGPCWYEVAVAEGASPSAQELAERFIGDPITLGNKRTVFAIVGVKADEEKITENRLMANRTP